MLPWNKRIFSSLWPSLNYSLAKQIVVIDESLHSFSVFVSIAVRQFTRWNGINQLRSDEHELVWVGVYIRALVIRHAKRIFSTQHFVAMCDLSGCTRFFFHVFSTLSHKRHDFPKKYTEREMCFDFLYNFCMEYFSFKEEFSEIFS